MKEYHLFFSLIFSSSFRKAEIKSFLSVHASRVLISETISGTGDKYIHALPREDVHVTHCQLTPVDLPTRNTYAATYLRESGVKSSRAFFSPRFPAGILLYIYDTSMLYIVTMLPLYLVFLKSLSFCHWFSFYDRDESRRPRHRLHFSHICK